MKLNISSMVAFCCLVGFIIPLNKNSFSNLHAQEITAIQTKLDAIQKTRTWINALNKSYSFEESSEITEFDLAFWNKTENPKIMNSYKFNGDEFELEKAKKQWELIRKSKFIFFENLSVEIGVYDFKKKSLPLHFESRQTFGRSDLVSESGVSISMIDMFTMLIPMEMEKAERLKKEELNLTVSVLCEPKIRMGSVTYYEVNDNGLIIRLGEETAQKVFSADPSMRYQLKKMQAETKTLELKPIHYIVFSEELNFIYSNVK